MSRETLSCHNIWHNIAIIYGKLESNTVMPKQQIRSAQSKKINKNHFLRMKLLARFTQFISIL